MKRVDYFQPRSPRLRRGSDSGSAYILSLMVIIVLTIVGMSLALTTQTEIQIGAAERTTTRVFYAADTGIEVALARGMVAADHSALTFRITDDGEPLTGSDYELFNQVDTSPFVPILDTACNLCEINNSGTYSENAFRKINNAVTAQAERFGTLDGGITNTLRARKTIAGMIEMQPWKVSPSALFPIDDPAQMAKIKF
jgi:hypothetical protein